MDEASKARPYYRPGVGFDTDKGSGQERTDQAPGDPKARREPEPSTGELAKDRWFLEERGGRRVPKRLPVINEARVTSHGPLKITGNITLVGEDGQVTHANQLSLCRCGASKSRPFCDESHIDAEFLDNAAIDQVSDCPAIKQPQTLTLTCIKGGPYRFQGFLRVFNSKGQECNGLRGLLCRCGKSTRKPFCDCQ